MPEYGKIAFLGLMLGYISFRDIKEKIIPGIPLLLLLVFWPLWQYLSPGVNLFQSIASGLAGGGVLFLIELASRGGLGRGDVYLMALLGLYLGPVLTGLAFYLSVLAGAVFGIALVLLKFKKLSDPLPFGPFLSAGVMVSLIWGKELISFFMYTLF